jgi:threonine dehydratase
VELVGASFEAAVAAAEAHVESTGATLVHAFEDPRVIAGQGTIGLELVDQAVDTGTVLVPIGGGGLAAGISLALRELRPALHIVGVVCTPGLTIADGIAVKHRGEFASSILDRTLDDTVEVTDEEISEALVLCLERTKLLVEGAGAVGLAALLAGRAGGSGPAAVVLSGGNIDATTLIPVMRDGLTRSGRFLAMRMLIPDRPGELRSVLDLVAEGRGNVVSVDHRREGTTTTALQTEVVLVVSTRDEAHREELLETLRAAGYAVERLGPPS